MLIASFAMGFKTSALLAVACIAPLGVLSYL